MSSNIGYGLFVSFILAAVVIAFGNSSREVQSGAKPPHGIEYSLAAPTKAKLVLESASRVEPSQQSTFAKLQTFRSLDEKVLRNEDEEEQFFGILQDPELITQQADILTNAPPEMYSEEAIRERLTAVNVLVRSLAVPGNAAKELLNMQLERVLFANPMPGDRDYDAESAQLGPFARRMVAGDKLELIQAILTMDPELMRPIDQQTYEKNFASLRKLVKLAKLLIKTRENS